MTILTKLNMLAGAAGCAMLLAIAALAGPAGAEDKVLARVNGIDITESDLRLAEEEIGPELGRYPAEARRSILVDFLIENRLFSSAGDKDSLGSGAAFEARMAYYRHRALRDAYVEKSVRASVTDEAMRKVYDEQVKSIPPQEEVRARHILVDKEEDAKAILEELKGGGDFEKIAQERSTDKGSGANGGDLGYFGRGQMVKPFEDAAFALENPGDLSGVVQSQFGFHIIRLEDKRTRPLPTFEQVKDQLQTAMLRRKYQEVAQELRAAAQIEYVDKTLQPAEQPALDGASPGADEEEGAAGQ